MSDYHPFDQSDKLGEPPWDPSDGAVQAWEEAHGHDPRLDCYPEYGCGVLSGATGELIRAARAVVAFCPSNSAAWVRVPAIQMWRLQVALEVLEAEDG